MNRLSNFDLAAEMQKHREAYMVRHAIPCDRHYTDAELEPVLLELELAERRLYGTEADKAMMKSLDNALELIFGGRK